MSTRESKALLAFPLSTGYAVLFSIKYNFGH